jgi:translation elongation factor EF-Tu-like GTPase
MNRELNKPMITADVQLLPPNEGGRNHPFNQGYVPHVVVEGNSEWLGVRVINQEQWVQPGQSVILEFELMYWPRVGYEKLIPGARFRLVEGPNTIGHGTVREKKSG